MKQIVVCKDCGFKRSLFVPDHIVWDHGNVKCECGKIINYNNEILESLYI